MTVLEIFLFLLGFPLLVFGADYMIKGAIQLANYFEVPPFVVGVTIVGFGTSAPELLISVQAALKGQASMALGNVLGSNIANVLLALGISSLFWKVPMSYASNRFQMRIFVYATIFFVFLILFPSYGLISAIVSLIFFITYMYFSWNDITEELESDAVYESTPKLLNGLLFFVLGFSGLILSSNWLINGGQKLALQFGVDPTLVGLIFFAVGTSLPEVITSIYAIRRGQYGLSVGNIIGSNVFNSLLVLPGAGIIETINVSLLYRLRDLPILAISAAIVIFSYYYKVVFGRTIGLAMISLYIFWVIAVAYTSF